MSWGCFWKFLWWILQCLKALGFNRVPASGKGPLDLAKVYNSILSIITKIVRIKYSPFFILTCYCHKNNLCFTPRLDTVLDPDPIHSPPSFPFCPGRSIASSSQAGEHWGKHRESLVTAKHKQRTKQVTCWKLRRKNNPLTLSNENHRAKINARQKKAGMTQVLPKEFNWKL